MAVSKVFGVAAVRLAVSVCSFGAMVAAQRSAWPELGSHVYRGVIATGKGQLAVQMSLALPGKQGDGVTGEYRYAARGRGIQLEGAPIGEHGELVLREFVRNDDGGRGAETGRFDGKLDAGARHFTGTWHSGDDRRSPRFALELVAVDRVVTSKQPLGPDRTVHSLVLLGGGPLAQAVNDAMLQSLLGQAAAATIDDQPTWPEFRHVQDGTVSQAPAALHTEQGLRRWAAYHIGDELVSLGELAWEFTGGAHGNYGLGGLNFVLRDGKVQRLQLSELAVDDRSGPKLFELVREKLRELGATDIAGLKDGPLDGGDLQCFLVSPAGVVFGFGPYHVGCYAEGQYVVQLTWSELRSVLSPPPQLDLTPTARAVDAAERRGR